MMPMMPTPVLPGDSEAVDRPADELHDFGFYNPEELDPFMDTTGLTSCCIYAVVDYGLGHSYEPGEGIRCVRGHTNAVMCDDGKWRSADGKNVAVKFTHPSWRDDG